jgi:Protein of unknown function (DUF3048) N-terminal domain/Protein of unknown function (DUF3048) C-terminal domain
VPNPRKRSARLPVLLAAAGTLLTACSGGATAASTPSARAVTTPAATPTPTATPAATPAPPTPSPIPVTAAPLVVQVENSDAARPQSGINSPDVLVEYTTEGGITRFSAVFLTAPAAGTRIGPVRSARLATVHLAQLLHAVLAYSGASTYINGQLSAAGVLHYDENSAGGDLFRVAGRAAPHNLYTDGAHLADLEHRAAPPPVAYSAWLRGPAAPGEASTPAPGFHVPMSTSEVPHFAWNPRLGGYTRSEPSTGPMTDADTGAPFLAPTVVVMQVDVTVVPAVHDVNGVLGLDHDLAGGGPAQVFTGGNQYAATWSEGTGGGLPALTLADGTQAPVAPGLVAICLVPKGQPAGLG